MTAAARTDAVEVPVDVPSDVPADAPLERGRRPQAFVIGASVPALVAAAASLADLDWIPQVALGGVLAGSVLAAWAAGPLGGRSWAWVAAGLGILAPIVSAVVVLAVMVMGSSAGSGVAEIIAGVMALLFYAIAFGLALGAPIAFPVALVVGWLVRRSAGMPVRRAWVHVGALGVAGAIAVAVALPPVLREL